MLIVSCRIVVAAPRATCSHCECGDAQRLAWTEIDSGGVGRECVYTSSWASEGDYGSPCWTGIWTTALKVDLYILVYYFVFCIIVLLETVD